MGEESWPKKKWVKAVKRTVIKINKSWGCNIQLNS